MHRAQVIAAAELIAELGWGRVTTRAVADRAGLPHGTVSYHFRGKQDPLTRAALHAFQQAVPVNNFAALDTVNGLLDLITAELDSARTGDPMLSRLMLETMREAERDSGLCERMGTLMGCYRQLMVETVRADQQRGAVVDIASAAGGELDRQPVGEDHLAGGRPGPARAVRAGRDRRAGRAAAVGRGRADSGGDRGR